MKISHQTEENAELTPNLLLWTTGAITPVQKLPNLFPSFDPGPIGFSTCDRRGAHGVARVGTTSDYDRQDHFQILCCGRDILMTILILKCQKQKVHGEFGSTESLEVSCIRIIDQANCKLIHLIHYINPNIVIN